MNRILFFKVIIVFIIFLTACTKNNKQITYRTTKQIWKESLGNHRAVLQIDKPNDVIALDLKWRRPDKNVSKHRFLIINATTGDTVRNIQHLKINNEVCSILFGPIATKGIYYFYYLPFQEQKGCGFYYKNYYSAISLTDSSWLKTTKKEQQIPKAKVIAIESRTKYDSFYPMEVIATNKELSNYQKEWKNRLFLFPENRCNPIRMRNYLPLKWMSYPQKNSFKGTAQPNEYYTFQVGLWSPLKELKEISYSITDLVSKKGKIEAPQITCFNTEGVNPYGKKFTKKITLKKGLVQPLWFGIDIEKKQPQGLYKGLLTIYNKEIKRTLPIMLEIKGEEIEERGDNETWRHSRLRWLNSTLGIENKAIPPYFSPKVDKNKVQILGREIFFNTHTKLPTQITAWQHPLLARPVQFIIETNKGEKRLKIKNVQEKRTEGNITKTWNLDNQEFSIKGEVKLEFDGWMNYTYTIIPKQNIKIKDIRLILSLKKEMASYFLGAGLTGQLTPQSYDGKWDMPIMRKNNYGVSIPTSKNQKWLWPFDSFWIGNAKAGIHCELRGSSYTGPLLNLYRPSYPESWYNKGKGGFKIRQYSKKTEVVTYSGERELKTNEKLKFDFAFLITPVKKVNTQKQFSQRYYHNGNKPVPTQSDVDAGVRIINIHHANEYNPFINYPFLTTKKLRKFTAKWHKKGCKVKLYYTLRELSSVVTELWAIRSLNNEILKGGNGGGYPWCREHLVENYTPQWYHHFDNGMIEKRNADAALLTTEGDSRWYNYYIEGLSWMIKHLDIDGIYLDDVSFDRKILKRMRRAMNKIKPNCIIDLHSNTGFSKGPANQYAEFFPYIDKLWFGESFIYNKMTPANWLIESSGIPFGLMGDMLHAGGNKWLGLQYGMTVRHPWKTEGIVCDPRYIWKIWDEFEIDKSTMIGYWDKENPITTNNNAVKVTTYIKKKQSLLLSIGNYAETDQTIKLQFNWKKLGINPKTIEIKIPEINYFQKSQHYHLNQKLTIPAKKGFLLIINPKK